MRQQGLTEVLLYGLWHMGNRCTKAGTEVLAEGSCGNVDKRCKDRHRQSDGSPAVPPRLTMTPIRDTVRIGLYQLERLVSFLLSIMLEKTAEKETPASM